MNKKQITGVILTFLFFAAFFFVLAVEGHFAGVVFLGVYFVGGCIFVTLFFCLQKKWIAAIMSLLMILTIFVGFFTGEMIYSRRMGTAKEYVEGLSAEIFKYKEQYGNFPKDLSFIDGYRNYVVMALGSKREIHYIVLDDDSEFQFYFRGYGGHDMFYYANPDKSGGWAANTF